MQNFLNLTLPLKQDDATQQAAKALIQGFNEKLKPAVEQALNKSEIVHFARFLLVGKEYIQILTTFDGDPHDYAMFFWNELNPVFKAAYELVQDAPTGDDWNVENFLAFNALPQNQAYPFYLYSSYPGKTVRQINAVARTY